MNKRIFNLSLPDRINFQGTFNFNIYIYIVSMCLWTQHVYESSPKSELVDFVTTNF